MSELPAFRERLAEEPWRFDLFSVLRRLERSHPDRPRIGDSAARAEDYVSLAQNPFMAFPAANIDAVDDDHGRMRLMVRFLGFFGPQGALPIGTTEEAYGWALGRDDSFARFVDIFQNRFLQLFFRAWADARPIAQHDRPGQDRFRDYIGSTIGIGTAAFRDADSLDDLGKIAFAGLIGPQVKSAARLEQLLSGLFGVTVEVEEFIGSWLPLEPEERGRLGRRMSGLGTDLILGGSLFSVKDKFRIRIFTASLAEYERFLPSGDLARGIADAVFLMFGEQTDWDVELAIPAGEAAPVRLGLNGRLGWTSWIAPNWSDADRKIRTDTRFHLMERLAGAHGDAAA